VVQDAIGGGLFHSRSPAQQNDQGEQIGKKWVRLAGTEQDRTARSNECICNELRGSKAGRPPGKMGSFGKPARLQIRDIRMILPSPEISTR